MTSLAAPASNKRKDGIWFFSIAFLLLIGAGLMLYPDISHWLASKSHAGLIEQYQHTVDRLPNEEMIAHFEKARAYNDSLVGTTIEDPFVPGSGSVIPKNYYEILNIQRTMGVIDIPAIDVRIPIFHGTDYDVLMRGVGHISNTPFPIGQMGKHAVLTGHTGIPSSRLFTDLELLEIGDVFFVTVLNKRMAYQVDQLTVVLPHEIDSLRNIPSKDLVTLVTCTPYAINSHRLLVRGCRIPYEVGMEEEVEILVSSLNWRIVFVSAVLTTLLLGWIVVITKNRKRSSKG